MRKLSVRFCFHNIIQRIKIYIEKTANENACVILSWTTDQADARILRTVSKLIFQIKKSYTYALSTDWTTILRIQTLVVSRLSAVSRLAIHQISLDSLAWRL